MAFQQFNQYAGLTPVRVVSTSNVAGTYYNGPSNNGVGATLTVAASSLTIDSVAVEVGDRVLLQTQTNTNEQGIYVVNSIGTTVVLQRAADQQNIEQMLAGQFVSVAAGSVNAGNIYTMVEPLPAQLGIDALVWNADPSAGGVSFSGGASTANAIPVFSNTSGDIKAATGASTFGQNLAITGTLSSTGNFSVSAGTITASGAITSTAGNITSGSSGDAGTFISFPASASKGTLILSALDNTNNDNVTIRNALHGQATVYSIPDVGAATGQFNVVTGALTSGNLVAASGTAGKLADASVVANRVLYTTFATPDAAADLVSFDVTCGQAALAAGGEVILINSSGAKQYKLRALWINSGGTNFSGGGGDRLGAVTDGTTVYSVVPATNMQTLINAGWGMSTPLPFPAAAAINTSTAAGADLVFKYSGGTTDYTAGSIVVSGIAERVA